ncbi:MAG: nuclear transport factor 2 family protein [Pyrinomonadaceae bacterium]
MRKIMSVSAMLMAASLILASCEAPPAANNVAVKPANAANNAVPTAPNTAAVETDLKKMTTDMAVSLVKDDVAAMEKLYGDNYVFVGPDGSVATRAQRIDAMKTGNTKYESITYDDISVRVNPEATGAVVVSKATVKGKNMGLAVDGQYRVSHVWSKSKDGWKLVHGQTTPLTATAAKVDDKKVEAPPANK